MTDNDLKKCPCCGSDLDMRRDAPPFAKAVRLMNAVLETLKECDNEQFMQIMNTFFTFTLRPIEDEGAGENEGDENVTTE